MALIKEHKLYVLKNPDNGDIIYVGQTSMSLKRRLYYHLYDKRKIYKTDWIKNLLSKNKKPIIVEISVFYSQEEINNAEIELIKKYREEGIKLTNICNGGNVTTGYKFTEEQKKKMMGRIPHNFKKSTPEEQKKKISKSLKDYFKTNKNLFYGKKHKVESEGKISESNSKKVALVDNFGNIIKTWKNSIEAGNELKLLSNSITKVCSGKRNSLFNKKFIYI
jgi:hypothetical protein